MMPTLEQSLLNQHQSTRANADGSAGSWIEVLPHVHPRFGGMSVAVPQLASKLVTTEHFDVQFAAFCPEQEAAAVANYEAIPMSHWPASRLQWLRDRALQQRFSEVLRKADGVHIHGLWEASTSVAARTARQLKKPYVLSAHGMLEPWALRSKRLKKKVYTAFAERANVEGAACLHALTHAEAEDYRRFGSRRPIAVIPNGVEVPNDTDATLFLNQCPELRGKRIVLYLGRIHPKKGLDLLMDAWQLLAPQMPDAALVVAGPDADGFQESLQQRLQQNASGSGVVFTGMLHADGKWSALAAAHCFVLPSYSEGLSVAVLEALSMGVPVIVSTRCHMPEVTQWGAGFVISPDLQELYLALETMLTHELATHVEISRRAKQLVRERFHWPVVAKQMAELYSWVQGGSRPRTVELLQVTV